MKYRYAFLIFLFAFLIQGTFLNVFSLFHTTPNLILCLVVMFSLFYEKQLHAIVFGVLFGVLADLCFMQYTGISSLGYLLLALCTMAAGSTINRENLATLLLLTVFSTILFQIYVWVMYFFLGSRISILYVLGKLFVLVPYNVAVAAFLYHIFIGRVTRFRNDRYYYR